MFHSRGLCMGLVVVILGAASGVGAADGTLPATSLKFEHHFVDTSLQMSSCGQTAVADLDKDGKPDFVLGRQNADLYWYRYEGGLRWTRHVLGHQSPSDVGAACLDVDGDGWIDVVTSGAWYRNPRNPREKEFTRMVFDAGGGGAHDVVAVDIDGDGKPEIVTASQNKGIAWYKTPADPSRPWPKHVVGPAVHGSIAPAGFGDIAGHGHVDVVSANTWYENVDGKGLKWVAHANIPFGRKGPFGVCVRCCVVDIDGDGRQELVMADCDIVDSKIAILRNEDGHGGKWSRSDLAMSFTYGSLHSLAVADLNNDGRLDILSNEQEELLPPGRKNPRWVIWENRGNGQFAERIILDGRLGGHELQVVDLDGEGRLDILSKPWSAAPWNACQGKFHVDCLKNVGPFPAKKE
jgi:hypothetical protein